MRDLIKDASLVKESMKTERRRNSPAPVEIRTHLLQITRRAVYGCTTAAHILKETFKVEEINSGFFQSNFRADRPEFQVSIRERLSTGNRNPASAAASTSRSTAPSLPLKVAAKPASSGVRGRLSLKPQVESSHHQVVRKRISAPGPYESYKR